MPEESSANNNPYSAPKSDLELNNAQGDVPSISEALSRGYDFSIGDVLSEAWGKVSGSKGTIWGAALLAFVLMFAMFWLMATISLGITKVTTPLLGGAFHLIVQLILTALTYPIIAGLFLIGIRRAGNYPIRFTMIFGFFNRTIALLITYILASLTIFIPIALLMGLIGFLIYLGLSSKLIILGGVLGGICSIYLGIAYILAVPLVTERNLSPWQALKASRKAVSQHWFKVFGLMLVCYLFMVLSGFTLFIALIWVFPLSCIAFGVLYRTIFGVLPPAPAN